MIETTSILVSVHLTKMSAARTDKTITDRVMVQENASGDAGKWSTKMFPNGALEPIAKIDGEIRKYFTSVTLPWADSGVRLLPQVRFMDYSNEISNFSIARQDAIDKFFQNYNYHIQEARNRLQGMFRPEFYPTESVARGKFQMASDVQPVPTVGDFRTDAPKEELRQMKESLEAKMQRAKELAESDLADRIAKPLAFLIEKLTEAPKDGKKDVIFRDTLITNIRDIAREIPAFNVTGNPIFTQLHEMFMHPGSVANFNPENLRTNPAQKKLAVEQAGAFLEQLNDIFGPAPVVEQQDAA